MAYVLRITPPDGPTYNAWEEGYGQAMDHAKQAKDANCQVDLYEAKLLKSDEQIRKEIAGGGAP
jgi:hypothetical protein